MKETRMPPANLVGQSGNTVYGGNVISHHMETLNALLALCAGVHQPAVDFP